jgi:glutamine synthetase
MADQLQMYKYIIKNVAYQNGYTVTFMPKPVFKDNGSGMHCHQSLWKSGVNQFFDEAGYALVSQTALHYIGGILKHAPSLLAFCAPTTNSYRRLVPGYEAREPGIFGPQPLRCVRIRVQHLAKAAIEFRAPDQPEIHTGVRRDA